MSTKTGGQTTTTTATGATAGGGGGSGGHVVPGVVRVCVCGDVGVGKTSLIISAATDSYPTQEEPPPVLPPTRLPSDILPDLVPVVVADTSAAPEWREQLEQECQKADVVVVCYKCSEKKSLERVGTYWLPELRHMQVDKPIILVGCKEDELFPATTSSTTNNNEQQTTTSSSSLSSSSSGNNGNGNNIGTNNNTMMNQQQQQQQQVVVSDVELSLAMEQHLANLIDQWKEVEVCLQCSARKLSNVIEVFSHAQKCVMHPTGPLYDAQTGQLKPQCVKALKRIFQSCDVDQDGYLSNKELNAFQTTCFNTPLQPEELEGVKKVVQTKIPDGIHPNGITLKGFVYLHALFVARGRMDTTWTVLRKFGYDNSLHLREDLLREVNMQHSADQVVELSEKGKVFFRGIFQAFDKDEDGVLSPQELDEVFSTSPSCPWQRDSLANVVETSTSSSSSSGSSKGPSAGGFEPVEVGLTANGFLSMWDLTTMQTPKVTLMYMLYLGFKDDLNTAIQISRRRKHEIRKGQVTRNVLNCFVFSTKHSNTRIVLDALIGKTKTSNSIQRMNSHFSSSSSSNLTCSKVELSDAYAPSSNNNNNNIGDNSIGISGGGGGTVTTVEKTLVMHQYVLEDVQDLLHERPGVMASCDLALFAYDGMHMSSFEEALSILKQVEQSGPGYLPCVLVATSATLDESVVGESLAVCQDLKMVKPFHISTTNTNTNGKQVFAGLCEVARSLLCLFHKRRSVWHSSSIKTC